MSTKKDKFNKKDRYYMNLAFKLARDKVGLTGENPAVGCVIVKNNQVISLGQTGINGRPHAEFNAIKESKQNLKGSKIYVEGKLQTRKWQDKDGNDRWTTEIVGNQFNFLDSRPSQGDSSMDQSNSSSLPQSDNTGISEEDIPF